MKYRFKALPLPNQSNQQIKEYLQAVEKGGCLLTPLADKWHLKDPHQSKKAIFSNKSVAITAAQQQLAKETSASGLFIFDQTGELIDS